MRQVFVPTDLPDGVLLAPPAASQLVSLSGETMGTNWRFQGFVPAGVTASQVQSGLLGVFARVIADFSNWDDSSFISRFNRATDGSLHRMPPAVCDVLREAFRLSSLTEGAFNPCLGAYALDLAFAEGQQGAPQGELDATRVWSQLRMQGDRIEKQAGIELDLSAIAKGYAVDQMADVLNRLGLQSFLVEIGGEFVGKGVKPDGQPWWVSLPAAGAGNAAPVLALCGLALATSGTGHRVYRVTGGSVPHIVGRGAGELAAVSVIAESCMAADGWATALFALGIQRGMDIAAQHGVAALFYPLADEPMPTISLAAYLS